MFHRCHVVSLFARKLSLFRNNFSLIIAQIFPVNISATIAPICEASPQECWCFCADNASIRAILRLFSLIIFPEQGKTGISGNFRYHRQRAHVSPDEGASQAVAIRVKARNGWLRGMEAAIAGCVIPPKTPHVWALGLLDAAQVDRLDRVVGRPVLRRNNGNLRLNAEPFAVLIDIGVGISGH